MRGRRIAEAPDGVGRHMRAHGCGLCTCKAHGRAVVEEVCGATEGIIVVIVTRVTSTPLQFAVAFFSINPT